MIAENVIGLTGGIGSGKSTVSAQLESYHIPVIDADVISRQVVAPGELALTHISEYFGPDILRSNGELNREQLRALIFSQPSAKVWLEQLLHPLIGQRIEQQLHAASHTAIYCVLSSPLLFETQQYTLASLNIAVDLPQQLQLERSCLRDGNSKIQIQKIIDSQISRAQRCQKADIILDNSSSTAALQQQVEALHKRLLCKFNPAPTN